MRKNIWLKMSNRNRLHRHRESILHRVIAGGIVQLVLLLARRLARAIFDL